MSLKVNNISSDNILSVDCSTTFINQVEFSDFVPHCSVVPEYGNDICNKSYVDSHIASGGANFLYFNYSVASNVNSTKQLGQSIVITTTTELNRQQLGTQLISSFITNIGIPYITTIPSGIWSLNQFGMCDGNHNGTLYYYFKLRLYKPSTSTYTELGTSGNSNTVDALTTPALYFATLSLGETNCSLEDRIVIEVWSVGVGTGSHTFNSYYQGSNYSYITCPLLTGQNLLNQNNAWTGTNSFSQPVSVQNTTYPNNSTTVPNTAYLTNYVNVSDTQTIGGIKTFSSPIILGTAPTSIIQLGGMSTLNKRAQGDLYVNSTTLSILTHGLPIGIYIISGYIRPQAFGTGVITQITADVNGQITQVWSGSISYTIGQDLPALNISTVISTLSGVTVSLNCVFIGTGTLRVGVAAYAKGFATRIG
jgi:hypothetical protein